MTTTTIETTKTNSLARIGDAIIHFKNYRGDLDKTDYYTLEGDRNAWYDIKVDFKYDYMMNQVKKEYKDTFNRILKVKHYGLI